MFRYKVKNAVSLRAAKIRCWLSHPFSALPLETYYENVDDSPRTVNPVPDFNDIQSAYQSKSTNELLRAAACFRLCQVPILVPNAEKLLKMSRRIITPTATDLLLKATMYGHFCAGEDQERIQPVVKKLDEFGVGNILDYAAESDESFSSPNESICTMNANLYSKGNVTAREYDYESEAQCDKHVEHFKQCITDVSAGSKDGYAAIKVTALGNPKLLSRMSVAITEAKRLFEKFDTNKDGFVTRNEFELGYK
jgi:proline dehydrogenase